MLRRKIPRTCGPMGPEAMALQLDQNAVQPGLVNSSILRPTFRVRGGYVFTVRHSITTLPRSFIFMKDAIGPQSFLYSHPPMRETVFSWPVDAAEASSP